MKNLLLFLFIATSISGCKEQVKTSNEQENFQKEFVKRNIQFLNGYEYLFKFGKVDSSSKFLNIVQQLDSKGNLIKTLKYKRPDSVEYPVDSIFNKFDSNGNLIESVEVVNEPTFNFDAQFKSVKQTLLSTYNSNSKRISLESYRNDVLLFKTAYKYNSDGNVEEYISYDGKGKLTDKTIYKYSGKENIGHTSCNSDGKVEERIVFSKVKDDINDTKSYNAKDSLESVSISKKSKKGLIIDRTYKSGDYYRRSTFTYNDWNLGITETVYEGLNEPTTFLKFELIPFKK